MHPFLDFPTPIVVAHRGASGEAPENTLEAFATAVEQGCTYLEEILTSWPDARVIIDPKTDAATEPVCALLHSLDAWDRVCLGAFSDRRVKRVRKLSRGRACTSMGPAATATAVLSAATTSRMPRLGADCLQVPIRERGVKIVTERFVQAAHRARLPVQVWTVDQPRTMNYLLDLGVDAIMTNRPRVLFDVLAARAAEAART